MKHGRVVAILREEGLAELPKLNLVVTVSIVSLEPEVDLLGGREYANRGQAIPDLSMCENSVPVFVEDTENVLEVEVSFQNHVDLMSVKIFLN